MTLDDAVAVKPEIKEEPADEDTGMHGHLSSFALHRSVLSYTQLGSAGFSMIQRHPPFLTTFKMIYDDLRARRLFNYT